MEEVIGGSKRKWALVSVAFLLGIAVLAEVIRIVIRTTAESTPAPTATESGSPASETESPKTPAWRKKRAQLGNVEVEMRARVGRLGSRMHPRRHAYVELDIHEATPGPAQPRSVIAT
jgi:hypothetical protein